MAVPTVIMLIKTECIHGREFATRAVSNYLTSTTPKQLGARCRHRRRERPGRPAPGAAHRCFRYRSAGCPAQVHPDHGCPGAAGPAGPARRSGGPARAARRSGTAAAPRCIHPVRQVTVFQQLPPASRQGPGRWRGVRGSRRRSPRRFGRPCWPRRRGGCPG